jgi:peptidoglycan/xylan/chitin deacetylase (PgdA/CDA1 family)
VSKLRKLTVFALSVAALGLAGCGSSDQAAERPTPPDQKKAGKAKPARVLPTAAEADAAARRFAAKGRPIYCGGRKKRWISLTFDDGPGPYSKHVLALLRRRHVPRTFFIVGRNVDPFRRPLKSELRSRSEIGNHSWSHPLLPSLPKGQQRTQLADTNAAIKRVSGAGVFLFRPPYGGHNEATDRVSRKLGMATILWDVDSRDSLGANSKEISRIVKRGLRPGAIILMHENHGQTVRALRYTILPALKKSGMTPVTVGQMLAGNPPSARQLAKGRYGCQRNQSALSWL